MLIVEPDRLKRREDSPEAGESHEQILNRQIYPSLKDNARARSMPMINV